VWTETVLKHHSSSLYVAISSGDIRSSAVRTLLLFVWNSKTLDAEVVTDHIDRVDCPTEVYDRCKDEIPSQIPKFRRCGDAG